MTTSDPPAMPAASTDTVPTSRPEAMRRVVSAGPRLGARRGKVFKFIVANPRATANECAAATGMSVGAVYQQQSHLRAAGLIPERFVSELGPQRAKVFEFMIANPEATAKECSAAIGISFHAVRQHQFRLRTAGLIPRAPAGARRAGSLRSLIALHETWSARIRGELEAIAAGGGGLHALLEPALRRRHRAKLRRLQARLRHHESRLAVSLEILIQEGFPL